jgi:hypothetical protein
MQLNKETLNKIAESPTCKAQLSKAIGVHERTLSNYIKTNSIMLTTAAAMQVICNYFNLTYEQALDYGKMEK